MNVYFVAHTDDLALAANLIEKLDWIKIITRMIFLSVCLLTRNKSVTNNLIDIWQAKKRYPKFRSKWKKQIRLKWNERNEESCHFGFDEPHR